MTAVVDPSAVLVLALVAAAYAHGVRRAWAQAGPGRLVTRHQTLWFTAGMVALAVALLSPLDTRADHSLTAHMIQHVVLLVVAAPALVLGAPLPTLLWSAPRSARARCFRWWRWVLRSRRGGGWAAWAGVTLVIQGGVMWAWHAPVLYEAALHHSLVHIIEHVTFVTSAGVFWWAIGLGSGHRRGAAVPLVFAAALPGTALGAALTLSSRTWYADYPSLPDQEMAGVVMWAFAGLLYVLVAAALFGTWLAAADRTTPARPLTSGATT